MELLQLYKFFQNVLSRRKMHYVDNYLSTSYISVALNPSNNFIIAQLKIFSSPTPIFYYLIHNNVS